MRKLHWTSLVLLGPPFFLAIAAVTSLAEGITYLTIPHLRHTTLFLLSAVEEEKLFLCTLRYRVGWPAN